MGELSREAKAAPPSAEEEAQREKEREEQEKRDANLRHWLEELGQGMGTDRHGTLSNARTEGTCASFLDETNEWLSEGFLPVMWAKGPPGVGKSVLASAFIDNISEKIDRLETIKAAELATNAPKSHPELVSNSSETKNLHLDDSMGPFKPSALAYIYFAWDERENQSLVQVYAQLLLQLIDKCAIVKQLLHEVKDQGDSAKHKPVVHGRWKAGLPTKLRNIFPRLPQSVVLVMDALDEAPDVVYKDVQSLVEEMSENSPKFLLFSRTHVHFQETELKSGSNMRILPIESKKVDIETHIKKSLEEDRDVDRIVKRKFARSENKAREMEAFYSRICEKVLATSENT